MIVASYLYYIVFLFFIKFLITLNVKNENSSQLEQMQITLCFNCFCFRLFELVHFARSCRILHFVVVCYALANLVSLVQNYASCNFACKSLHSALKMFHFQSLHWLFCFIVLVALQSSHWQNYAKKSSFFGKER